MGTSHYDEYGALILGSSLQPIEKPVSKKRILLLGDSVTARRQIENALKQQFGTERFEYWNCGVEGYNTFQEVRYFKRFCRPIRPDHVIVTLHNNDYQSTPVSFYDDEGRMAVFSPDRPSTGLNPTLYQYSYIYRLWFSWEVGSRAKHDDRAGAKLIRSSFDELRALLAPDRARLTVLVLPPCRSDKWTDIEASRHAASLQLLKDLGIEHYDLANGLAEALKNGVDVQENKGDVQHPSAAAGEYFVRSILEDGFALR